MILDDESNIYFIINSYHYVCNKERQYPQHCLGDGGRHLFRTKLRPEQKVTCRRVWSPNRIL